MQCLSCGKEIGNALGMCEECAAARMHHRAVVNEQCSARQSKAVRYNSLLLSLVIVLALAGGAVAVWASTRPYVFRYDISGPTFKVALEGADEEVEYSFGSRFTTELRVLDLPDVSRDITKLTGITRWIVGLKEQEYKTLQSEYVAKKICAAPYLNGHARHYFLVAQSPALAAQVDALRLSEGMQVSFSGITLRPQGITSKNSRVDIAFPSLPGGVLLVDAITVKKG